MSCVDKIKYPLLIVATGIAIIGAICGVAWIVCLFRDYAANATIPNTYVMSPLSITFMILMSIAIFTCALVAVLSADE